MIKKKLTLKGVKDLPKAYEGERDIDALTRFCMGLQERIAKLDHRTDAAEVNYQHTNKRLEELGMKHKEENTAIKKRIHILETRGQW